jgi:hypothetical protein
VPLRGSAVSGRQDHVRGTHDHLDPAQRPGGRCVHGTITHSAL